MARGGQREGAGRPARSGPPRRRLTVALREDLLADITEQAEKQNISLSDHLNQLLAAQLHFVAATTQATTQTKVAKSPPPSAPVRPPSYKDLESNRNKWLDAQSRVDRRSPQVRYWYDRQRQDKPFLDAMLKLGQQTHSSFPKLITSCLTPITEHIEALALASLPPEQQKWAAGRVMIQQEKDLKQVMRGFEEAFRQAVIALFPQENLTGTTYLFPSERPPSSEPLPPKAQIEKRTKNQRNPAPAARPEAALAEPVPSDRELQSQVQHWLFNRYPVDRRSQQVQYWRKAYRQDKAFRAAVDCIATKTQDGVRELLLDALLPLGSHKEVLGLAALPAAVLKRALVRLLKGEKDLKQALGSAAETFRQAVTEQARQKDPLYTTYRFFKEP